MMNHWRKGVLVFGAIVILIGIAWKGLQPCGWLDGSLIDSGCIRQLDGDGTVVKMAFTQDGATLATQSTLSTVLLWKVSDGAVLHAIMRNSSNPVYGMDLTPDGTVLAVSFRDAVQLWGVNDGELIDTLKGMPNMDGIVFAPDGTTLASTQSLRLWQVSDGALQHLLDVFDDVNAVAFAPDGKTFTSAGRFNKVRLWNTNDGKLLRTLVGHSDRVTSVTFAPDGDILASSGWDNTVRIWRIDDGTLIRTIEVGTRVHSIAFSPDGAILATGNNQDKVQLWRVSDGSLLHTIKHRSFGSSVKSVHLW